jgi:hypothetical protein
MALQYCSGCLVLLIAMIFAPARLVADGSADLARYEAWVANQRKGDIVLLAKSQARLNGDSEFAGVTIGKLSENLAKTGEDWLVESLRESFNPKTRSMSPAKLTELRSSTENTLVVPKKKNGEVNLNLIQNPEVNSGSIRRLVSRELSFLFGYSPGEDIASLMRKGTVVSKEAKFGDPRQVILTSKGKWGTSNLTLDSSREYAPVRFVHQCNSDDLTFRENTPLGKLPINKHPWFLPEEVQSTEVSVIVDSFSTEKPNLPKAWHSTEVTRYRSGKSVTIERKIEVNYSIPESQKVTAKPIPAGVPVEVTGNKSGVEYVWDGKAVVPNGQDPATMAKLKGTMFTKSSLAWLVGAVVVIVSVAVALYRLRRRS